MKEITFRLDSYLRERFGFNEFQRQLLFMTMMAISFVFIKLYGRVNIYAIALPGFVFAASLCLLYWDKLSLIFRNIFKYSLEKRFINLFLGILFIMICCYIFAVPFEVLQKIEAHQARATSIGVLKAYPFFVLIQQFIYFWAPKIVFSKWRSYLIVLYGSSTYAYAHSYYELAEVPWVSFFAVGLPCAYLCTVKKDYISSYLLQLIVGYAGFAIKFI